MDVVLSDRVFEWLLVQWAGYGDKSAELFPSLGDAEHLDVLSEELDAALRNARLAQDK